MPDNAENIAPEFRFRGYWVDHVHFQTNHPDPKEEGERKPARTKFDLGFRLGAGIDMNARFAQVTLVATAHGDPKWQPYLIEVSVTGQFDNPEKTSTQEQFDAFVRTNVPTILFPYVRELIDRVSADGQFGRMRLNPMNLAAVLPSDWDSVEPVTPSNGPELPSSQSPSASQESEPQP